MSPLVVLIGAIVAITGTDGKCPAYFDEYNLNCYYYGSVPVHSVDQALETCVSLGGYLLNINAELEYQHTKDRIMAQGQIFDGYWTGGVYRNGHWVWEKVDHGLTIDTFMDPDATYYHWGPGEPSSGFPMTHRHAAIMLKFRPQSYHLYSERGDLTTLRGMSYICEADWVE